MFVSEEYTYMSICDDFDGTRRKGRKKNYLCHFVAWQKRWTIYKENLTINILLLPSIERINAQNGIRIFKGWNIQIKCG